MHGKRLCEFALVAMLALVASCSSDSGDGGDITPPPPATGTIAGAVTAAGSGVQGVTVTPSSGGSPQTTNASGQFQFGSMAPGTHTLSATMPNGFRLATGESASKSVTISAGQTSRIDWSAESTGGAPQKVTITASGASFSPKVVTIARGTTVRWVNGDGSHTVTPDNAGQAGVWTSANLGSGQTFEHTFTVSGSYDYHCVPHQSAGMTGTIVVQ